MRDTLDRAYTPPALASAIVGRMCVRDYLRPGQRVWEPCSGQGAFTSALLRADTDYPPLQVCASDIDPDAKVPEVHPSLLDDLCGFLPEYDALRGWPSAFDGDPPDWVVTNPPFARHTGEWTRCSKCMGKPCVVQSNCEKCDGGGIVPVMETIWHKHVEMALNTARVGVAMLLRNSWIEPVEERRELVDMVNEMWPVTPRPSYSTPTGPSRGSDTVGATVFIWRKDGFRPEKPVTSLVWKR